MPRGKREVRMKPIVSDGFINVAVSKTTRTGLNDLKEAMGLRSQAEVIDKLVAIGVAIHRATR